MKGADGTRQSTTTGTAAQLVDETRTSAVDMHVHLWPGGLMHPSQRSTRPLDAEYPELRSTLVAAGVDLAVILPASIHEDNDEIMQTATSARRHLRAIVVVDPWEPGAEDLLAKYVEGGAVGVRIAPRSLMHRPTAEFGALWTLLDEASELGIFVQWTLALSALQAVEGTAARQPGLVQLVDHLGLPNDITDLRALSRIRELADIEQVRIKLSGFYALSRTAYPYRDTWPWAEGVVQAFGPQRVLWASDWPLSTESADYRAQLALVDLLPFLDAEARTAIRSTNARALLQLDLRS